MKLKDSIIGFAVGDAVGVPVEFRSRNELKLNKVVDMEEYGTHYQVKGTWSDDTSMTIATMDSIINKQCIDYNDIMNNFGKWVKNGEYSAGGVCFDVGNTCRSAIDKFNGSNALECGLRDDYSNGNGSLMRMLPIAFYCYYFWNKRSEIKIIEKISSLTHANDVSVLGCYLYVKYIHFILDGNNKFDSYKKLRKLDLSYFRDKSISAYNRILKKSINKFWKFKIRSSGYVVDTLEAVLWVVLNTNNYKDSILSAVNLGDDTDTIAALTGGITGILYGLDNIDSDWILNLKRYDYLTQLCDKYELFLNTLGDVSLDKDLLDSTIDDLRNNPDACTISHIRALDGSIVPMDSVPGEKLDKFISYLYENDLLDLEYVSNSKNIENKRIEDYTIDDTLTALTKIIRGDKFCSGLIYSSFKNGELLKFVEKLRSFVR